MGMQWKHVSDVHEKSSVSPTLEFDLLEVTLLVIAVLVFASSLCFVHS